MSNRAQLRLHQDRVRREIVETSSNTIPPPVKSRPRARQGAKRAKSTVPAIREIRERDVLKSVRRFLSLLDKCYVARQHQTLGSTKGVPDLLVCLDGIFVAIEVKSPRGRLSADQSEQLDKISAAGGVALVVRSVEELSKALFDNNLLKNAQIQQTILFKHNKSLDRDQQQ